MLFGKTDQPTPTGEPDDLAVVCLYNSVIAAKHLCTSLLNTKARRMHDPLVDDVLRVEEF
jgi:hypothetical protein